jgi:hypothetical protein
MNYRVKVEWTDEDGTVATADLGELESGDRAPVVNWYGTRGSRGGMN